MTASPHGAATADRTDRDGSLPALPRFVGPQLVAIVASLVGFLVLLVTVTTTGGTNAMDLAVLRSLTSVRSPTSTAVAQTVTALGSFPAVVVLTLLAAALLGRRTHSLLSSVVLVTAVTLSAATVYLVKVAVARERPPVGALLGNPSPDASFPSGNTTTGAVVCVLAALLAARTLRTRWPRRLVVAGAIVLALGIGVTRVYLGYHWLTDVLAGWLLASAVTLGASLVTRLVTWPNGSEPGVGVRRQQPPGSAQ